MLVACAAGGKGRPRPLHPRPGAAPLGTPICRGRTVQVRRACLRATPAPAAEQHASLPVGTATRPAWRCSVGIRRMVGRWCGPPARAVGVGGCGQRMGRTDGADWRDRRGEANAIIRSIRSSNRLTARGCVGLVDQVADRGVGGGRVVHHAGRRLTMGFSGTSDPHARGQRTRAINQSRICERFRHASRSAIDRWFPQPWPSAKRE
jgi:hypothetical protein